MNKKIVNFCRFLVQAFTWLEKNNAFNVVGIFRVPGNQNRIIGNHWVGKIQ